MAEDKTRKNGSPDQEKTQKEESQGIESISDDEQRQFIEREKDF